MATPAPIVRAVITELDRAEQRRCWRPHSDISFMVTGTGRIRATHLPSGRHGFGRTAGQALDHLFPVNPPSSESERRP